VANLQPFVAATPQGHVVMAGAFSGTASFGGGPLNQQGVGDNVYVAEFDCAGNHIWSKRFGAPTVMNGDSVMALSVGVDGSVLITGLFQGSIDFGTGPLTSIGTRDGFLAKLDAAGNAVFARSFGGAGYQSGGTGCALDGSGNAYVTGYAFGPQNFGGGVIGSPGIVSLLVVEVDATGNHVWSKAFGQYGFSAALALDPTGNVVLAGLGSSGQLDFGGGQLPPSSVFAAMLAANGSYLWSKTWGPQNVSTTVLGLTTGPAGEIVLAGSYSGGSIDFGGGPLPVSLNGAALLVKLTNAGAHVFSKGVVSPTSNPSAYAASVNASGEIYMAGGFAGAIVLDGVTVYPTAIEDVLFAKFAPAGTLSWVKHFGMTKGQFASSVALDTSGVPYLGGIYNTTLDLGNGPLPIEMGYQASFLARMAP
jgi:hypothetical protein